jgi:hypothetical protein
VKHQVLVVSHADADGHVIAEQVRRNLSAVPTFEVTTIVDPTRTKDHRTWLHLDSIPEIEANEYVFFVDLMFAPASFVDEVTALLAFVRARPQKRFFVLDHHPLPLRRLATAPNVRAVYREDVLDCAFGLTSEPSELMIIAALCESQPTRAHAIKTPLQSDIAKGVRRAAALGGSLPGEKLSALLRFNCWDALVELGREDSKLHRLPRGRRPSGDPPSKTLRKLDRTASELLARTRASKESAQKSAKEDLVSYDVEVVVGHAPPKVQIKQALPKDLEAIVMALELAALYLTTEPGAEFTAAELIAEAKKIGGDKFVIEEGDIKNVLGKAGFLKKVPGNKLVLK